MKNFKAMSIKNMKETLVNWCGGDIEEYNKIWDTFHNMKCLGYIGNEVWKKFFDQTAGWTIDGDYLIDSRTGEIIFDFDNGERNNREYEEYRA